MKKRLYRVQLETTIFVEAEDASDAVLIAEGAVGTIDRGVSIEFDWVHPTPIKESYEIPADWRNSYPFGGDGTLTCLEVLEGKKGS
jgi:hypothetical protein